jgi:hypothetical protein
LDSLGAVNVAASASDYSSAMNTPVPGADARDPSTKKTATPSPPPSNSLTIYFMPRSLEPDKDKLPPAGSLWGELVALYGGTQPNANGKETLSSKEVPRRLELRTVPRNSQNLSMTQFLKADLSPILRTRSALGVLKGEIDDTIVIYSRSDYLSLKSQPINVSYDSQKCTAGKFYVDQAKIVHDRVKSALVSVIKRRVYDRASLPEAADCMYSVIAMDGGKLNNNAEHELAANRKYLIVVKDQAAPTDAVVSWNDGEFWYYIDNRDDVSRYNLALLQHFLTIQATQTPVPSGTSISIGGSS